MGNTKIIPCGLGPVLVLVLLDGVVGGLGQWWADGGSQAVQLARCGALLAEAWEAAVVEEVLFGVLLWACLSWARRRNEAYPRRAPRAHRHRFAGLRAVVDPVGFAVMASSLIFGLAHLFPEGSLMAPGADIGVAAIQGVFKVTQATLFGAVMALLIVRSPYGSRPLPQWALSLVAPVIAHGLFDLLFWGPLLLTGGVLPSTYLTGNAADLVPLVITTVLLAWAVKSC